MSSELISALNECKRLRDLIKAAHYAGWYNGMVNAYKHDFSWDQFESKNNLSTTPSHEGKDAVAFLNWVAGNNYHQMTGCVTYRQAEAEATDFYTPGELYSLYTESLKQQK